MPVFDLTVLGSVPSCHRDSSVDNNLLTISAVTYEIDHSPPFKVVAGNGGNAFELRTECIVCLVNHTRDIFIIDRRNRANLEFGCDRPTGLKVLHRGALVILSSSVRQTGPRRTTIKLVTVASVVGQVPERTAVVPDVPSWNDQLVSPLLELNALASSQVITPGHVVRRAGAAIAVEKSAKRE